MAAFGAAFGIVIAAVSLSAADASPNPTSRPLPFSSLPGWAEDDHTAALAAFRRSCPAVRRPALCRAVARAGARPDGPTARRLFERWFAPVLVAPAGFLTGYYEPLLVGSSRREAPFLVPLLQRPAVLVDRPAGAPEGWPEGLSAARRTPRGLEPMPDRGAIEDGALGAEAPPLVFLADAVDAFTVHIQGSARIALADGRVMRVGFDGRNGYPYRSAGRVLAEQEGIPPAEMTANRLYGWLRAHPDRAPAIMRANRSYIFFREIPGAPQDGPVGAVGVPLTAGRSLAVDPAGQPYGTPVWLDGEIPRAEGGTAPLRRLVVAQDTGAAIVGLGRGDLFTGSGEEAGRAAGLMRHPVRWIALVPRPAFLPGQSR